MAAAMSFSASSPSPASSGSLSFDDRHTIPPYPPEPHTRIEPPLKALQPGQPRSLADIAIRSFALGIVASASLLVAIYVLTCTDSRLWRLPFFIGTLSTFHFLEFWTTAARNTSEATVSSFLLTANWPAYPIAHGLGCLECLVMNAAWREPALPWFVTTAFLTLGLAMVVAGQTVRSLAMLHAGASFNHTVQTRRAASHTLVTGGVYGYLRHPSYFGFFYWGLGTQLVLGNALCMVGYAVVLWKFFSSRVRVEEANLVDFFGDDYVRYRKRVGTGMPFVG